MKKIVFFAALLVGVFSMQAQKTMLSPSAATKALEIREGKIQADNLHAFVTLAEGVDIKALDGYGVRVNSVVGDMMTVQIPAKNFNSLVASSICSYIDLGHRARPYLDKARADMGIDYIHQGINLPQGSDGTGVVVGILDNGFEFGHPSFYDSTGTTLRIKKVWVQFDNSGTAPSGFSYGTEYATQADILAAGTDYTNTGHGTHVAGIAAGCGAPDGNGSRYRGIAPGADMVVVGVDGDPAASFDAIRYVHNYARSVGKPCVINMSYGTLVGPHDGTGSFDRMIENYLHTNPTDSIVLVSSAGNSGETRNHLHKQFSPTDTIVKTFGGDWGSDDPFDADIVFWGNPGSQFSVSVMLYEGRQSTILDSVNETPFIQSDVDSVYTFQYAFPSGNTYNITFAVSPTDIYNNRPSILVNLSSSGMRAVNDRFAFAVKSTNADLHAWSDDESFVNLSASGFVSGDYGYNIGGMGGNTDAVISVGSYISRGDVYSIISPEGSFSRFSSHGPTYDGRVKPDICAPGESLFSGWSSYCNDYRDDSTLFNGQYYYYGLLQGTSMSSPAAAGVIALWLQQNPSLNVDSVRTLLHDNALTDEFTGNIPQTGSNLWGWGKINAFAPLMPVAPMHMLRVTAPGNHGTVIGGGYHPQGNHTIEAVALDNFIFIQWNDGNSDNPRIVNLTSDTVFEAEFGVSACDTISTFPWYAEFDDEALGCWDIPVSDNGINGWNYVMGNMTSVASNTVDNWLVSPYVNVASGTSLFFNCSSTTTSTPDALAVTAINANGDTIVMFDEQFDVSNSGQRQVDLTPYAGQVIRIGFHHYACGLVGILMLNDVKIEYATGIEDIENSQVRIAVSGLNLNVDSPEDETVSLYDVTGRLIAQSSGCSVTYTLPSAGVYIVKVGSLPAHKVVAVK